jgi:hypothetical protein
MLQGHCQFGSGDFKGGFGVGVVDGLDLDVDPFAAIVDAGQVVVGEFVDVADPFDARWVLSAFLQS